MVSFWCVYIPRFVLVYFLSSVAIAAYFYPGGNHLDASQQGYDFTINFLSELGFYNTLSGETNFLSAFFFNSAMFMHILVGVGFLMMPKLFNDNIYSYVSAWLGAITISISCVFFAGVGLTPGDLYFPAHIFAVQNAFNLVFFAYLFICLAFFFSSSSNKYTIGSIMMFVITISYAIFISDQQVIDPVNEKELFQEVVTTEVLRINAILQKLVTIFMNISLLMFSYGFADRIIRKGF